MTSPISTQDISPLSAEAIQARIDGLAALSSDAGRLTRLALSASMADAMALVAEWMREAGMSVRLDTAGNVIGRYEAREPGQPALMLGSHIDTVRDAGRFDGILGVVTAIACVQALQDADTRMPFAIEIAAFGDEEGVRFGSGIVGAKAVAGRFEPGQLRLRDEGGTSAAEALVAHGLDPERVPEAAIAPTDLLGYVELHIEQGPVLEEHDVALGCVSGISGAGRLWVDLSGMAGHAGTVPMASRRDALAGAAECVLAIEKICNGVDSVGTVGALEVGPGAMNVIPGHVRFSVDIRSFDNAVRRRALAAVEAEIGAIAGRRGLGVEITRLGEGDTVPCAPWLSERIREAIIADGSPVIDLPSGAGHDGNSMSRITDIGMIFVRCKGGLSHHPAEYVSPEDIARGAAALFRFVTRFEAPQGRTSSISQTENSHA
ncbi:allantoate amidohydrolase [Terrihabitans sp. B22-R8]|uniref:allantoate amidohydrolase n=1 Tax=Terrihabitans sp. B22-R8 TaxID=3425128 RepID=UPI00403C63B6